jgi:hypothetical protein
MFFFWKIKNFVPRYSLALPIAEDRRRRLLLSYRAIGRSIINYAAPVWSPNASPSCIRRLQVAQNSALRIATVNTKMASQDHLHKETSILPVKQHNSMLSAQYLASCRIPGHPNSDLVDRPRPLRAMKATLHSAHNRTVIAAAEAANSVDTKDLRKQDTLNLQQSSHGSITTGVD